MILTTSPSQALENSSVVAFSLGPMWAYIVSGKANLKTIMRSSNSNIDNAALITMASKNLWGFSKKDYARVKQDSTGRGKKPVPGSEHVSERDRFFSQQHHIYAEFLTHSRASSRLADVFNELLGRELAKQPVGAVRTVGVYEFLRTDVTEAAIRALLGEEIFEVHPNLNETWHEYEDMAPLLFAGKPRWLGARPYKARDALNVVMKDYMRLASEAAESAEGEGTETEADAFWNKKSGARVSREMLKWFRTYNYDDESAMGFFSAFLLA